MRGQDMQWQSCVLTGYSSGHDGPIVAILDHLFCPARNFFFCLAVSIIDQACSFKMADYYRADIKSQGLGISPGYYECGPRLLMWWKMEEKYNQKKSLAVWFPTCSVGSQVT